ncbi:citrate/2-methylcitrate synthase [Burkholderia thailandensis]|uniref:citrate synthase (unknown stereospecificity) n=1 Tax=Burkholderia thailandensis TaxID=57975 RepID=A0AAW9D117_BURTH|nr:citrate/2-methylcitrate synthase [Burkholderia thailandensis]AIP62534.1 citrate synthase [Burkholderia thailandensis]AOI52737.1 citrate synthase [Burkholderia thailandensis]MCS3394093.1 MerR family DNA-binding transcriptional regulator [Burkholderia thailandensis]MCS6427196.1 MerR family DNA-binding transcriptional regulator [Burkholderia thailandensis]MCS6455466.1 MerR family DNA-binding transcriptional regulator [Burkholderia thailandensis]
MSRLSANEAAQLLGVSVPTLYAYVSRGLLRSRADGASKRRYYDADEVRLLARRRADAKRAGNVAERTLDWGVPVLESRITQIANGTLRYRGCDAIALATTATLEEAAALLWECPAARVQAAPDVFSSFDAARWLGWLEPWRDRPPLERALALLPVAAPKAPPDSAHASPSADEAASHDASADMPLPTADIDARRRDAQLDEAAALLRVATAALAARAPSAEPAHRQLAAAWRLTNARDAELLRMALVLCADHELNPSTFAVRCIASTGAPLFGAIAGGLAALSGPRHGGETLRVATLLDGAARTRDLGRYVAAQIAAYEREPDARTRLPGFGHPLYPDGDPRATLLVDALVARATPSAALDGALSLAEAAQTALGDKPTIDFALVALERALALPPGAALALFAAGRVAGWIAHALEQRADGKLIRPRARYVGVDHAA